MLIIESKMCENGAIAQAIERPDLDALVPVRTGGP